MAPAPPRGAAFQRGDGATPGALHETGRRRGVGGAEARLRPNANSPLFDDPEAPSDALLLEDINQAGQRVQDVPLVLPAQAKDDQTRMRTRRIATNISEPRIEGHKGPRFLLARFDDCRVAGPAQAFLQDHDCVVPSFPQKLGDLLR